MGIKHFKSKADYKKWLAYGHTHTAKGLLVKAKKGRKSVFSKTKGNQQVYIKGKKISVMHNKKAQAQIMLGIMGLIMGIAILGALIPIMVSIMDIAQNQDALNCKGYIDPSNASTLNYNASKGTNTFGCLIIQLYIPYILLAILIGLVTSVFLRPAPAQPIYG